MKALKVIGGVLGGCAALALVLAALASMVVNGAWVRGELTRLVEARTQRTLSIRGGLSLSLWPSLGLRAEQVSLSERQRPEEFAAFESAELTVDILPLLAGRIQVARVVVAGPRLTLVRQRDGSLNIADLLDRQPASTAAMPLPAADIQLQDGTLIWRNEQGGPAPDHRQSTGESLRLPLDGQLQLDPAKGTAKGWLSSRLEGSPIRLSLELSRLSPPALSFELTADRIDLDRVLPLFQGSDDQGGRDARGFDPTAIKGMDLRGVIRIGELHFAGSRTRDFRLQVDSRGGRLEHDGQAAPATPAQASRRVSR